MRILLLLAAFAVASSADSQWKVQNSGTTASLRGIDSVGKGVAWASGTEGTVLRTEDGGATWQRCSVPPGAEALDFRGVQAFDAKTAIVMSSGKGDLSRLYKTTDGCQTWKLVLNNPDKEGFWDGIRFVKSSPNLGSVIGDPVDHSFVLFTSNDQGTTWMRWLSSAFSPNVPARQDEAIFAASNSALGGSHAGGFFSFVTGGPSGARYLTVTAGEASRKGLKRVSFFSTELPFAKVTTAGAFSLAAANDGDVMIVGGDYARPDEIGTSIYIPNMSGLKNRDTSFKVGSTNGYRSAVAYDGPTKTWITVGPNGTDVSIDDGRNWRALKPGTGDAPDADQHWNALSLPFVVGPKGRIGKLEPEALKAKTDAH